MDLLRHLRIFVVVAEELHFGRAAELLGMAQPPLSRAVRRLEEDLGAELFDRSRRQVGLTPAGAVLLAEARELLAREGRTRALVRRAHDGNGHAACGCAPGHIGRGPRRAAHRVRRAGSGLRIDLHEVTTDEQLADCWRPAAWTWGSCTGRSTPPICARPRGPCRPGRGPAQDLAAGAAAGGRTRGPRRPRSGAVPAVLGTRLVRPNDRHLPGRGLRTGAHPARPQPRVPHRARDRGLRSRLRPGAGGAQGAEGGLAADRRTSPHRRICAAWPRQSPHPAVREYSGIAVEVLSRDATSAWRGGQADEDGSRPWSVVFG